MRLLADVVVAADSVCNLAQVIHTIPAGKCLLKAQEATKIFLSTKKGSFMQQYALYPQLRLGKYTTLYPGLPNEAHNLVGKSEQCKSLRKSITLIGLILT